MKSVVHIICRDKFTSGYINFMKINFKEFKHIFFVNINDYSLDITDSQNVFELRHYSAINRNAEYRKMLHDSDAIIVSGFFGPAAATFFWNTRMLKKTYIQFWGGDFYCFEDKAGTLKDKIKKILKYRVMKLCKALVFLIPGEYNKFVEITGISNNNCVAPMPDDPRKRVDFAPYRTKKKDSVTRILVGNCANKSNNHFSVFEMLKKFKDKEIEIICPLSYGDSRVRDLVIEKGKELFGNKFVAITKYMDLDDYYNLLAQCEIGVFDINRQQAMGNITALLGMGKKIYIRRNTTMWDRYEREGYIINSISEINQKPFSDFVRWDSGNAENNEKISDQYDFNMTSYERWKEILGKI